MSKTIGQRVNRYPSATPVYTRTVRVAVARLQDDTGSFRGEGQSIVSDWTGQPPHGG